jgi:uncharacterized membrane protein YraQ (UPF0718 family)
MLIALTKPLPGQPGPADCAATIMAFLVSGSVVSIWGALAIAPVLRAKPFILYLALALFGSLAAGWIYDFYCAWQLPL